MEGGINMSVFQGKFDLVETKDRRRYLKGWYGKTPILAFEEKKCKDRFHIIIDRKKLDWMDDQKKDSKTDVDVVEHK